TRAGQSFSQGASLLQVVAYYDKCVRERQEDGLEKGVCVKARIIAYSAERQIETNYTQRDVGEFPRSDRKIELVDICICRDLLFDAAHIYRSKLAKSYTLKRITGLPIYPCERCTAPPNCHTHFFCGLGFASAWGIIENDHVDALAKSATTIGIPEDTTVIFTDLKEKFRKYAFSNTKVKAKEDSLFKGQIYFRKFVNDRKHPWFHQKHLSRKTIVTICRMRANHHSLAESLFRKNIVIHVFDFRRLKLQTLDDGFAKASDVSAKSSVTRTRVSQSCHSSVKPQPCVEYSRIRFVYIATRNIPNLVVRIANARTSISRLGVSYWPLFTCVIFDYIMDCILVKSSSCIFPTLAEHWGPPAHSRTAPRLQPGSALAWLPGLWSATHRGRGSLGRSAAAPAAAIQQQPDETARSLLSQLCSALLGSARLGARISRCIVYLEFTRGACARVDESERRLYEPLLQNSKRSSYAALFLVYYFSFCFIHPIVADEFAEIHSPYSYFRGTRQTTRSLHHCACHCTRCTIVCSHNLTNKNVSMQQQQQQQLKDVKILHSVARTRRVREFYDEKCCSLARELAILPYIPIACDFRSRRYPTIQNFDTIRIYTVPRAVEAVAAANGPGSRPLSFVVVVQQQRNWSYDLRSDIKSARSVHAAACEYSKSLAIHIGLSQQQQLSETTEKKSAAHSTCIAQRLDM
ncbi:unnamed protein product, partial [Trichogramma brassicae]